MNSRASIAGAWTGGGIVTLLLATGAPASLWLVLALLLALALVVRG
jgi:hypothetical protein